MDKTIKAARDAALEWAANMAAVDDSKTEMEWLHWLRQALFSDRPNPVQTPK